MAFKLFIALALGVSAVAAVPLSFEDAVAVSAACPTRRRTR
jgi:hypothetical protein